MASTGHGLSQSSERREEARRVLSKLLPQLPLDHPSGEQQLLDQHQELMPEFQQELRKAQRIQAAFRQADQQPAESDTSSLRHLVMAEQQDVEESDAANGGVPERIGRYEIEGLIGQGGFGRVYLGWDAELSRHVAIKTPHPERLVDPESAATYLAEARLLAKLDYPGIVPVFDAGRTADGGCYLVSKWVEGIDLASRLRRSRLSYVEAVRVVMEVATALHYAHARGIVHRDIKPANILLDHQDRACLADFGLASRDAAEETEGKNWAGTPNYMSPEQARGESHRVDCRSDIFSLGVVFYEALAGERPFQGESREKLLEEIICRDPQSLREHDPDIPPELERICLKMLSKRAVDRYATAKELAFDLKHALRADFENAAPASDRFPTWSAGTSDTSTAERSEPAKIVPKGLRSFDAEDAPFFLQLLPGPRDREGVPENLRRWKHRIEELDEDETFAIGLMYGPSGCGKSSLIRAGLLPRLAGHVRSVYVEATSDESESQLLKRLHKCLPELPVELGLARCMGAVRRGVGLQPGQKVLLVIDQFEQWLSGRDEAGRRSLIEALRQCDGTRLQCLLLVRDDFWLAISRFMSELEVELLQGRNTSLVDLFEPQHARKVLLDFGRAYEKLPRRADELSTADNQFLDAAVAGLTEDRMVVPVRLALFTEIIKSRPWTLETLHHLGGAQGVGVTFLEETFCARTANPRHRAHESAARAVLEALLPQPGSPIKGHIRSYPELLDLSGYGHRPRDFKELMRILDAETRLLTPADLILDNTDSAAGLPPIRYYQLTHDYLVPSLREWLTKKQRATAAGRATLRLAERAQMWTVTRERRQLPSLWEWWSIRLFTRSQSWTESQRRMMRVAARRHAIWTTGWLVAGALMLLMGAELTTSARNVFMQVRAATVPVWLAFGQDDALFPLLQSAPDPALRSKLIHRLSPLWVNARQLVTRAAEPLDPSVRRGLLLAAGELLADAETRPAASADLNRRVSAEELERLLTELYQRDPDPGIHAAAEWTLRRLQSEQDFARGEAALRNAEPSPDRQWYLAAEGHTLIVVPGPARFRMGDSRHGSAENPPRDAIIRRSYSIASKEVTTEQFGRFLAAQSGAARLSPGFFRASAPANSPALGVTWYEAAAYCNWLSERDGIPRDQWCFLPNDQGHYAAGMRIAPNWLNLQGYRLPSEAEWEYACRAGTSTTWPPGSDPSVLPHYAHVFPSASEPLSVGSLKPNDLGLFDMLGNAAEWCLEADQSAASSADFLSPEAAGRILDGVARTVRGGSFQATAAEATSGSRRGMLPAQPALVVGFRVARSESPLAGQ